jgi:hypothetical protein
VNYYISPGNLISGEYSISSDKALNGTDIGLGAAIGLVMGPLIGLLLIRISNVGYIEASFALGQIAMGIVIGLVVGVIIVRLLRDRASSIGKRSVWGLFVLGVVSPSPRS